MGGLVPVTFERPCRTAAEFAERYRVLAAMSPQGGLQFTIKPDDLRAMAVVFDQVGKGPDLLIAVVETEKPLTTVWAVALAFIIASQVMVIGEIAARVLWGVAG